MTRPTAAVIGSGVAGLTAAYLLQRGYDVTLFEADGRLGGHAHTHELPTADGRTVDDRHRLHRAQPPHLPEPPAAVRRAGRGDAGVGHVDERAVRGLRPGVRGRPRARRAVPAGRRNLARPAYLRMLAEVRRFHRHARGCWPTSGADDAASRWARSSPSAATRAYFVEHFLLPVVSAVWSAGETVSLAYPARYLFAFLHHHGMLAVTGSPRWRTVVGGSRRYVEVAVKELAAVAVSTPVRALARTGAGVEVRDDADTVHHADVAVVATHPDQALAPARRAHRRGTASCWARSATRATSPSSTTTPRCCRVGRARGRRGTTSRPPARIRDAPVLGELRHEPPPAARRAGATTS